MPTAPPRICQTCGQQGCTVHPRGGLSRAQARRQQPWTPAQRRTRGEGLQQQRAVLFRASPFCVRCHVQVATIRDHVVPLAEGGRDEPANTQALCLECHQAKTTDERLRGLARSRSL